MSYEQMVQSQVRNLDVNGEQEKTPLTELSNQPRVRSVEKVEVIRVVELRGTGVTYSPMREVVRYYGLDGELLADIDPCSRW